MGTSYYNPPNADAGEGYVFLLPVKPSAVGQGTWAGSANGSLISNSNFQNSTTADGDNCTFNVYLAAGTYTIQVMYIKGTDTGILDVYIDADKVISALDTYNNPSVLNAIYEETSVSVSTAGLKAIKLELNGKNVASTDYKLALQNITFMRTA